MGPLQLAALADKGFSRSCAVERWARPGIELSRITSASRIRILDVSPLIFSCNNNRRTEHVENRPGSIYEDDRAAPPPIRWKGCPRRSFCASSCRLVRDDGERSRPKHKQLTSVDLARTFGFANESLHTPCESNGDVCLFLMSWRPPPPPPKKRTLIADWEVCDLTPHRQKHADHWGLEEVLPLPYSAIPKLKT